MASSKYGLTTALSDAVSGYEGEQARQAGLEKAAQESEMNQMKLEQGRAIMKREGVADSVRMLLAGDTQGAMEKYNSMGEDRMSELEFDPETGLVSFLDAEGTQRDIMIGQLMLAAGMNPKDLDTPEAKLARDKELATHKAKVAQKYGTGKSGKQTAYIQNLEYLMRQFTGGDNRKAMELYRLSKSDPDTARVRILSDLRKANENRRRKQKWTEEEMNKMARDSVMGFQDEMFTRLIPKRGMAGETDETQVPYNGAGAETPSVFNAGGNKKDPFGLL